MECSRESGFGAVGGEGGQGACSSVVMPGREGLRRPCGAGRAAGLRPPVQGCGGPQARGEHRARMMVGAPRRGKGMTHGAERLGKCGRPLGIRAAEELFLT